MSGWVKGMTRASSGCSEWNDLCSREYINYT
jgi:hypothetical protein